MKIWTIGGVLMVGFSLGSLLMSTLGFVLNKMTDNAGRSDTAVTLTGTASSASTERNGLETFLASNPFKVSERKPETKPEPVHKEPEEVPEEDTGLEDVILRGTLPGIGAWIDTKGSLTLLLVGREIENYKLKSVSYSEAVFNRDDHLVTKYIVYGDVAQSQPKPQPSRPAPVQPKQEAPKPSGNIVAADGNNEGQVPSELVSNMVQNPFDELKRIRIRPNEQAGGLEVQWIQNDSLLKRLGVRRGDVIRSVNGIPFTNMGDIANSISSLMHSDRFDVEVTRGGKSTALRYVVK